MLLSFHCPLREMSLLLLGGGLLFVDKTVRSYAAELWAVSYTHLDVYKRQANNRLKVIGRIEYVRNKLLGI